MNTENQKKGLEKTQIKLLKILGYGTIIRYKKKDYVFMQGADGDILMALNDFGNWYFINTSGWLSTWKNFKVMFSGQQLKNHGLKEARALLKETLRWIK